MHGFTCTASFYNFHLINGYISRIRTSNNSLKYDLQTGVQQLVNSRQKEQVDIVS